MKRCLALLALCAATAGAQDEAERSSRAYDIRFLTKPVENFKGPELGLESGGEGEGGPLGVSSEPEGAAPLTGEFLVEAITTNFDEDSWSDERNGIKYSDGVLYVTQTKENHEKIAKYIDMLRHRFSRRIVVEGEVLLLSPEAFAATGALPGLLTPDQDKALHAAADDPARGRTLTFLRTVAVNSQRVFAADLHEKSYVRDYDVEIAQYETIADPVTGDVTTGAVLDVKPILSNDMATVLMNTRFRLCRLRGMASFDPGTTVLGTIQLPTDDILSTRTTLALPVGRSALLCAGPDAGEKGWIAAVVLKPTLTGQAGADETSSAEKRQMRMFDVSSLTASVPDFPGPDIELGRSSSGGAPTTTFAPPEEEGFAMTPEQLIAAIQNNVARESWKNSRNHISIMGDQIVVVQTPAVLDEIAKFVAVAAPARNRIIGVESVLLALDDAAWAARRASLSGASPAEDGLKDLLASAGKGGVRVVTSASGVCMSGQRFHVLASTQQAFVQDYDVQIAIGVAASDPVVGLLQSGCVLDVRPTLGGDGKHLHLEIRPTVNEAADLADLDTKAPNIGRIQRTHTSTFRVRSQMYVTDGAWVLAGLSTTNSGGKRETMAMLVRTRSMEAK